MSQMCSCLTGSWLSGLLFAVIFISTGEWVCVCVCGGGGGNADQGKQPISAVRISVGFPGNGFFVASLNILFNKQSCCQ